MKNSKTLREGLNERGSAQKESMLQAAHREGDRVNCSEGADEKERE